MAKQKGATEAQVKAIEDFERGPFSEKEKLGFRLADRVHQGAEQVDGAFYAQLECAFTRQEIIELMAVAAAFEFFTRFVDALRIPVTPQPKAK